MFRPTATLALHRSAVILAGTLVVILGSGCLKDTAVVTTTPSACAPPGGSIATASRSDVATWASALPFVPASPSRAYVYGFASSDSVVIEAVDTVHFTTLAPKGCLIARLTSAVARPALGIGAGANYILGRQPNGWVQDRAHSGRYDGIDDGPRAGCAQSHARRPGNRPRWRPGILRVL